MVAQVCSFDILTFSLVASATGLLRSNCKAPHALDFFVQRGVPDLLLYNGRVTQGRAYLVVTSYAPLTAWYFDGYINVAAVSVQAEGAADKEAHVTNMDSNQNSRRLPTEELLTSLNLSVLDQDVIRKRIREAFLQVFLSLTAGMEKRPGSFSLYGVDFLVDSKHKVRVLESNCNCELFTNAVKFGNERVNISKTLVSQMMHAVVVTNMAPDSFKDLIERNLHMDAAAAAGPSSLELLYTEAVKPAWSLVPVDACYPVH